MTQNNPYAEEVFQVNDNFFVIKLKKKEGIDNDKFTSEKDAFKEAILERKKGDIFRIWLEGLKEKADIERDMSRVI